MAIAGNTIWKGIFKHIRELDEGEDLDTDEKIRNVLIKVKINPDLASDLQDMFCDQLSQYTKQELLSGVQVAGPDKGMESYRRATVQGKKRLQNIFIEPEIESQGQKLQKIRNSWRTNTRSGRKIFLILRTSMRSISKRRA